VLLLVVAFCFFSLSFILSCLSKHIQCGPWSCTLQVPELWWWLDRLRGCKCTEIGMNRAKTRGPNRETRPQAHDLIIIIIKVDENSNSHNSNNNNNAYLNR
jgi:hypothetical protein